MKYIIYTLGCKVNQYETQAMETLFAERGLSPAAPGERADAVIVNSCAVTAESGRKSRQALRRLAEENPGALRCVCGCWSQTDAEAAQGLAEVVWGSADRRGFVDAVADALESRRPVLGVDEPFRRRVIEDLPAGAYEGHARAWLKIEDGCANFCSYCIIPYSRGRVRSLEAGRAASLAAGLAAEGYKELVLTGIEIASWGFDLPGKPGLADCVCAVAGAAPGVRIRLGSIEPTAVTEDFCARLAELPGLCPHFHLSMQSGSDGVLKRMNRKYDTAEFYAVCERLRRYFPGCALTTDLITGFPGESEAEFAETLAFIRKCGFAQMHVFPYSRRPGTKADALPGQLTHAVKNERARAAHEVALEMQREYLESCVGSVQSVLFESEKAPLCLGHAPNYMPVSVEGEGLRGLVKNVKITAVEGQMLVGAVI